MGSSISQQERTDKGAKMSKEKQEQVLNAIINSFPKQIEDAKPISNDIMLSISQYVGRIISLRSKEMNNMDFFNSVNDIVVNTVNELVSYIQNYVEENLREHVKLLDNNFKEELEVHKKEMIEEQKKVFMDALGIKEEPKEGLNLEGMDMGKVPPKGEMN
jgi:hypothetical protein